MGNSAGPDTRALPLRRLYKEFGAVEGEQSIGANGPAHFGSPAAEYKELRSGCGLVVTSDRSILVLTGADRVRFLNGMVTGDISSLQAGHGVYCFFTTARGRILSDAVVIAPTHLIDSVEKLVLLLPSGLAPEIKAHLSKFVVADRVEIAAGEDLVTLMLLGAASSRALCERALQDELPKAVWHNQVVTIGDTEVLVVAEDLGEIPGFTLLVDRVSAEALSRNLLKSDAGHPITLCGSAAFESARIETGTLQFGKDFSVENFPKETGIDAAVSYKKGCYLGQEVVARIHYRGQVNHVARGLLFEGAASAEGTSVQSEGRDIGLLSSATHSPLLDRGIGLSILLRRSAEPGIKVDLADGKTAEVVELPFELPAP